MSALKERIAAADGLLVVTPEYNQSTPGVLKNAIDWLSRPGKDVARVFAGKPVGIIGADPRRRRHATVADSVLPVLRTLGAQPWFGKELCVAGPGWRAGGCEDRAAPRRLSGGLTYDDAVLSQRGAAAERGRLPDRAQRGALRGDRSSAA